MGDHLWAGIPPQYVTKPMMSTQPRIPPGLINRVPAGVKLGNVTSAGWQVVLWSHTVCEFRSGKAYFQTAILRLLNWRLCYSCIWLACISSKDQKPSQITHSLTASSTSTIFGCNTLHNDIINTLVNQKHCYYHYMDMLHLANNHIPTFAGGLEQAETRRVEITSQM